MEKVTKEKEQEIQIFMKLVGKFTGERLPKDLLLQRKIRTVVEDECGFEIIKFKFDQDGIDDNDED